MPIGRNRRIRIAALVVAFGAVVSALGIGPAAAREKGAAQRATKIVLDDFGKVTSDARACLERRLQSDAALADAIVSAGRLTRLDAGRQAQTAKLAFTCLPDKLAEALGASFGKRPPSDGELRCASAALAGLDVSVFESIIAANGDAGALDPAVRDTITAAMFPCLTPTFGRAMLTGMQKALKVRAPSRVKVSAQQYRCVGDGLLAEVGASNLAAYASGNAAADAPRFAALLRIQADCVRDFAVGALGASFANSGASKRVARCFAEAVLTDPALRASFATLAVGASGTASPDLQAALTTCQTSG